MYKVLIPFTDDHDARHVYSRGDNYPRAGYKPDEERIAYLLSGETSFGEPVIVEVEDVDDGAPVQQDGPDHKPPDDGANGPGDTDGEPEPDEGNGDADDHDGDQEAEEPKAETAKPKGKAKK